MKVDQSNILNIEDKDPITLENIKDIPKQNQFILDNNIFNACAWLRHFTSSNLHPLTRNVISEKDIYRCYSVVKKIENINYKHPSSSNKYDLYREAKQVMKYKHNKEEKDALITLVETNPFVNRLAYVGYLYTPIKNFYLEEYYKRN